MKDLFGNDIIPDRDTKHGEPLAEHQHKQLIGIYGAKGGQKCKDCVFFIRKEWAGTFFKCGKAHRSNSTATDWRANWQACGAFEKSDK